MRARESTDMYGTPGQGTLSGRPFYKLSGSGNDFAFFDVRGDDNTEVLARADVVRAICARGTGIGADGVVLLDAIAQGTVRITYFNSDGTRADLCGNATLCTARLARELGLVGDEEFRIETDAGVVPARVLKADPEIAIGRVEELAAAAAEVTQDAAERRIGFARVGVPHLVVEVADVIAVDVDRRGTELRAANVSRPSGANVNFVSRNASGTWQIRTFERGVEGETLACGTGTVAAAALISVWYPEARTAEVQLVVRSGRVLHAGIPADAAQPARLRGEGRIVFAGRLGDLGVEIR